MIFKSPDHRARPRVIPESPREGAVTSHQAGTEVAAQRFQGLVRTFNRCCTPELERGAVCVWEAEGAGGLFGGKVAAAPERGRWPLVLHGRLFGLNKIIPGYSEPSVEWKCNIRPSSTR
ncbi:NTF2-related export protein 2 isoform X2 [Chiloscyllium plagiosum]|uniref:NTF2-related export protein 2 isoform X2 n=1 Tax=Chiloscyllium plagiosum TaxID=36176 RepID=UPI001CB887FF|nr:NTF2-related export protein 2 isoform X2 [Chiloscyllium plagiosum]